MEFALLKEITILFAAAIAIIFIFSKIRLPAIIGFLFTGILLGPHGFALLSSAHEIELLAEIGIIFLLFTIGVELSISELLRLKKPVFLGGGFQVGITILVVFCIAFSFAHTIGTSIVMGFLVSLSSTAIVLKILQNNNSIESPQGRLSLSILIFQDLIIVPMVLALPFLAGTGGSSPKDIWILVTNLALIVVFFLIARKIIPSILRVIMINTRNKEILLFSILVICLGVAFFTSSVGLSLSLGAFLAGLLISESEYSTSALDGILPFRDVFTSLFFISVGMLFNLHFAMENMALLLLLALGIIIVKITLITLSVRILSYPLRPSLIVGFSLAQVGEFSFILAKTALDESLLTSDMYQYFLGASIITMICTPFLIDFAPHFALWCNRFVKQQPEEKEEKSEKEKKELEDHLIIVGYGLSGRSLSQVSQIVGIPYNIVEMNPETVRRLTQEGENVFYGDATQLMVLEHLGISKARVLAIVISDIIAVRHIVELVHNKYPSIRIIARTRYVAEVDTLKRLGASEVIAEEFESSIEVFSHVLSKYYVPVNDIYEIIGSIRNKYYKALRMESIDTLADYSKELSILKDSHKVLSVHVKEASPICGKTLKESTLREKYNLNVIAIRRDKDMLNNIDGDTIIEAGDMLYVFGEHDSLQKSMLFFQTEMTK